MEEKEPTGPGAPERLDEQKRNDSAPGGETDSKAPEALAESEPAPAAGAESVALSDLPAEEKAGETEAEAARLRAMVEAAVYITDEPLTARQIAEALEEPLDGVQQALNHLMAEYERTEHGLTIREVAEGYKMGTKPEHHEAVRAFVRRLQKPLKLSMAALETLAVIAYKQPITAPEIMDIRGVQGAGVLKTLLDRKLITTAGRKEVVGKPILYKTTKDFLVQFGLKSLKDLPTLKEFEELARVALADEEETLGGGVAGSAPEPEAAVAGRQPEPEESAPEAPGGDAGAPEDAPLEWQEPQPAKRSDEEAGELAGRPAAPDE